MPWPCLRHSVPFQACWLRASPPFSHRSAARSQLRRPRSAVVSPGMPVIDGEKWACSSCIKGHRVSGCNHTGMASARCDCETLVWNDVLTASERSGSAPHQPQGSPCQAMRALSRCAQVKVPPRKMRLWRQKRQGLAQGQRRREE